MAMREDTTNKLTSKAGANLTEVSNYEDGFDYTS
jgi:hypothetical protein